MESVFGRFLFVPASKFVCRHGLSVLAARTLVVELLQSYECVSVVRDFPCWAFADLLQVVVMYILIVVLVTKHLQ